MSSLALPDALATAMRGSLIAPGDPDYDERRALYNAMIDRRPALIARCTDAADVIAAIAHARSERMPLAVRGGGHNGGGLGSVDDGLVIDLSAMRGVIVDPVSRVARVLGGSLIGDVDHATNPFGLALPSGIISTTGVGGITLGGGLGHLTRGGGLTIDNMIAADVVLADGRLVRTSESELPDLFWALRGGGGNFGVAVSFSFSLQEVGDVLAGPTLWPMEAAPDIMRAFDTYMEDAPDIVGGFFLFLEVPPGPPFPEHLWGQRMCGIAWCVTDPEATDVFDELLAVAPPALHGVQRMPFPAWNSGFDGLYPPGHQWYWRADFFDELTDDAIAAHVEQAAKQPTMQSSMHLYPINGAAGRVDKDATAWAYRDAKYGQVVVGVDPDPAKAGLLRDWTVGYHEALHPHSMGGAYVNMMMDDEGQDRVRASYRDHYDRLAGIKAVYDPENLFRVNQNILPAA